MKLSKYQEEIADFIKEGKGNLIVKARAGSGKTFSLVEAIAKNIKGKTVAVSFNKSIATELQERMPENVKSQTAHSLGFGAIRNTFGYPKVDNNKYKNIVKEFITDLPNASFEVKRFLRNEGDLFSPLFSIINLCRITLTSFEEEDLFNLCSHYDIDLPDCEVTTKYIFDSVERIIKYGDSLAKRVIDFNDMLWLVASKKEVVYKWKYLYILVDECQDLSKAQLETIRKCAGRGARFIFVGDNKQAINGFAGADNNSFDRIKKEFDCKELSLPICYRCPSSHLELVKDIVPDIEAKENALKGTIEKYNSFEEGIESLKEGDMVLCRTNAPLISLCFKLIAKKMPARIKGKNIGESLVTKAKKIIKEKGFEWKRFSEFVEKWKNKELTKLEKKGIESDDSRYQNILDNAECLVVIWSNDDCLSLTDFKKSVESIFSDSRPGIMLSSVHKAKGLENDRIFILQPELLPAPWVDSNSWQYEQELNLFYVAHTRSKEFLGFIPKDTSL